MKTLVIGLGSTIAGDDGIGIYIARRLKSKIKDKNINIIETYYSGLKLIDLIYGYDKVVIIDALKNGNTKLGEVELFDIENEEFKKTSTMLHNQNFVSNFRSLRQIQPEMPKDFKIIGVNVDNINCFNENLSSRLKKKLPEIERQVREIIGREI